MPSDVLEADEVAQDAPAREPWHGLLDYYGYHAPSGAWYFVGWIEQRHVAPGKPTTAELRVDFENGTLSGPGIVTYFYRPDLGERGSGVVVHFPSSGRGMGRPAWMNLLSDGRSAGLTVPTGCQHLRGTDLGARLFAELS
ncbi:MAG TPA: hypothetical protein VJ779_22850, partial [Acetobacteraceae bacterium]|nr:hypothetical protein [Acetobacteraceae bacterium]